MALSIQEDQQLKTDIFRVGKITEIWLTVLLLLFFLQKKLFEY